MKYFYITKTSISIVQLIGPPKILHDYKYLYTEDEVISQIKNNPELSIKLKLGGIDSLTNEDLHEIKRLINS